MVALGHVVLAQVRIVSGRVTSSDDNKPLPGVSVVVKGTSSGTASDSEGRYSVTLLDGNDILVFSFTGFETVEVPIGQRLVIDVSLSGSVKELEEVVVSALSLEKDRSKVGTASTSISGQSIQRSGEPTLLNGMAGKSSGLIINRSAGDPGSGSYIQIRGQSSIVNSIQPLIVVDGVPVFNSNYQAAAGVVSQSRINDINPNDIESVEILKGAPASALWGTRAGNGVIVITTKKGKSEEGKLNITYSGTYSVDEILTKHPLQTTYGQGTTGVYKGTNVLSGGPGIQLSFGDKIANRIGGPDSLILDQGYFQTYDGQRIYPIAEDSGKRSRSVFDPYEPIYERGTYYDQTISISGGNRNSNFYISIGDLNQKGIVKENSTYRRTSFRFNNDLRINRQVKIGSSFMYSRLYQQGIIQGNSTAAVMVGLLRTPPDWDNGMGYEGVYYDPDEPPAPGRQLAYRNQIGRLQNPGYDNPVWSMHNDRVSGETDRFIANMQFEFSPTDWWTFTVRPGVDSYFLNGKAMFLPGGVNGAGGGMLNVIKIQESQFNLDAFSQAHFSINQDIRATFLLGFNANQRAYEEVGGSINSFIVTTNPPLSLDNAPRTGDDPFNMYSSIRSAAAYSTIEVDYKDEWFLSVTGRAENSSVFSHTSNPTFFYPSVSASWHPLNSLRISTSGLNLLKLRAGYGVVATLPGPYLTATYWNPANFSDGFVGISASLPTYAVSGGGYQQALAQGNPNLVPETKVEVETGFDVRFLDNRFSLSATYFTNTIYDAIIPLSLAGSTGFSSRTMNAAEINNHGLEIEFSIDVLRMRDFTWNLYGNWTRIRNKVAYLGGDEAVTFGSTLLGDGAAVRGYPVGVHFANSFYRDENGLVLDSNGFPQASPTATVLGDPNSEWRLALGTRITWKNVSLNILMEHSHGGQMHGGTRGAMISHGTHKDTEYEVTLSKQQAASIKNYSGKTVDSYGYRPNSDSSYTVRGYIEDFGAGPVLIDEAWWTSLGGGFNTAGVAEHFIEPAQWTKLREISIGYSLRSPTFQKATKLKSIDFFLTGRNLFLWTEFKGNDPESNLRGPTNTQGRDYFNNPATRSFLITVNINY